MFICGHTSPKRRKKAYVPIYTQLYLKNPLQITIKQTCFCLCINSLCEQSTVHVLHRDMNFRFILSACAVFDFPHFTGHPAVQRHCTCTPQFVSKRFPKAQNIFSAVQRAPHMQKRCFEKSGCARSPVAWPTTAIVQEWVLKINGCMLTRFDMLYKGSHLWSHDTAKQKTQQASLAKMSGMNKSTTICHIVVTKC